MRCLALAQAWQDAGGRACISMAPGLPALEGRLKSEGIEVHHVGAAPGTGKDAALTAELARTHKASWVVVDGYHFDEQYRRQLKASGVRLLWLEDLGYTGRTFADVVLNYNAYAQESLYPAREAATQLLLGPPYVLLRREFLTWRDWTRQIPDVARNVLVTLGGSDPANATRLVVQALQRLNLDGLTVRILTGPGNPHYGALQSMLAGAGASMRLEQNAIDLAALMAWADLAICGGGGTLWEAAFMGLPTCVLVLADHQAPGADALHQLGVALNSGRFDALEESGWVRMLEGLIHDGARRRTMSRCGRMVTGGGNGAQQVVEVMLEQEAGVR